MFDPPPPHVARFHSDDRDEVHAFIARYDGNHRRTVLKSGRLGYSARTPRSGDVDIGWGSIGVRQKIEGVPRGTILHLPRARRHVYATGGTGDARDPADRPSMGHTRRRAPYVGRRHQPDARERFCTPAGAVGSPCSKRT
jgi:hypothetical protein